MSTPTVGSRCNVDLPRSGVQLGSQSVVRMAVADVIAINIHSGQGTGACMMFHILRRLAIAHLLLSIPGLCVAADYPDLLAAVRNGSVEVRARGAGGSNVTLRIRRMPNGPMYVRVAPGTYFAPDAPVQGQVALGTQWIDLRSNQVVSRTLETACCHIHRPAASSEHAMTPTACPDPRLLRLCASVDIRRDDRDAIQCAVWAITNNATRRELFGSRGTPAEKNTLRILERAGVDVGTLRLNTRSTSRALHLW